MTTGRRDLLTSTAEIALRYLETAGERPVAREVSLERLVEELGGPLPAAPTDPAEVIDLLDRGADPGLVVTSAGHYFGFVEGGVLPAALAADWLASAWDQNPAFFALSRRPPRSRRCVAAGCASCSGCRKPLPPVSRRGLRWPTSRASPSGCAAFWPLRGGTSTPTACSGRRRSPSWWGSSATPPWIERCACWGWKPAPRGRADR